MIVKGIFKTTKTELICGGEVTKGKLTAPALVRITRGKDKTLVAEAELLNLKRGPQDAREVVEGELCGMDLKTSTKIEVLEGDLVQVFTREVVARHL